MTKMAAKPTDAKTTAIAAPEPGLTPAELIARAVALRPLVREEQDATEARGHHSEALHEAFRKAGFYRTLQPKRFGGYEFEPITFYKIIVEISRGDPATGWCLALAGSHALIVGSHWPEAAQRDLFGPDGDFRAPHRTSPTGTATPVDGGYVVTGSWNYVSGIPYATHFIGNALIKTEGAPPQNVIFAAPREHVVQHDDWGGDLTLGMRGSGSYSVSLKDAFIPAHYVLPFTAFFAKADQSTGTPGTRLHGNPMYLGQIMGPYHASLVAPIVGAARASLDELREIVTSKNTIQPPFVPRHLHYDHQRILGQALTLTDAAEALLYQSCEMYMGLCRRWRDEGTPISLEDNFRLWGVLLHAGRLASEAVELIFQSAGSTAAKRGQPLQRYFRDVAMYRGHISAQYLNLASTIGRAHLGLKVETFGL
jgi:3-hydroxy-9,10-secoandrosta-1,3,5(10)-triene-9,17-dione monooxygenase